MVMETSKTRVKFEMVYAQIDIMFTIAYTSCAHLLIRASETNAHQQQQRQHKKIRFLSLSVGLSIYLLGVLPSLFEFAH